MDLCSKFNHSFICRRRRNGRGEKSLSTCLHMRVGLTKTYYLDQDLCNVKPIKQSKQENRGVSKRCINLYYWLYRAPWRTILDFSFIGEGGGCLCNWVGVSSPCWLQPTPLWWCATTCRQQSMEIGFPPPPPIAIGRTVKADSSLLAKA